MTMGLGAATIGDAPKTQISRLASLSVRTTVKAERYIANTKRA
ncbi:MAG: hypothetical protein AAFR34_05170 [Pseudomonadota bacterium]